MVKCIIIDTGVNTNHPLIVKSVLHGFSILHNDNGEIVISNNFEDTYGHGTAIYHLLQDLNSDVEYTCIKIPEIEDGFADEESLICALNYVYENLEADLINLSLGTTICENKKGFYEICKKLDDRGTVIFSAYDNDGAMSYPALFDCVVGVVSLDACQKKNDIIFIEDSCINIAAKGNLQRLAWNNPQTVFMSGNSFACAHASRKALEFMINGIKGRIQILDKFKEISKEIYYFDKKDKVNNTKFSEYKRVALFPFNKEMHSLVRFYDLLDFKIVKIYDTKYSGKVSSSTVSLMNDSKVYNCTIENIDNIDFDSFDLFVFGHFVEQEQLLDSNFRKELLEKLLIHNKKVFSYDDISKIGLRFKSVYCPTVSEFNIPPNRMGKLYRINKPVLGIFGTSSQQGKFTLQLELRRLFLKEGYSIGQIGSEPHSELFGFDYVYPFGYNSSVYISNDDAMLYLNTLIHSLCSNDIIMVGSQANTIPYDFGNLNRYMIQQQLFFLGTQPDAVVLMINPYDEKEYIEHTIKYLESYGFCKVIALTVFPMDFDNGWKRYTQKKVRIRPEKFDALKNSFSIPVYQLGVEDDILKLFNQIINFFS